MREPLRSNSRLKTCGKLTCMGNVANSAARKARSIYSRNSVRIVMIVCLRKSRSARCPAGHKVATCSELCLFPRGVFELVFHGHQLALALLQTSAMPLGLGRGHLGLLALERLFLLVHQKRREAPAFMPGMDRRWARRAQCPRAQQDLRSTRALNGRGHCIGGSPGIHAGEDVPA